MPKPLKAGGEVDSWCTKCRLVLNHRIIAMVGPKPVRVECSTCGSHHLYRRPKSEKLSPIAAKVKAGATSSSSSKRDGSGEERKTAGARASAAAQRERDQTTQWEHAIAGQPASAFKAYRVTLTFGPGELVRHPKFGDGVVARVIDRGKIEILFQDGPKTMAHGQVV